MRIPITVVVAVFASVGCSEQSQRDNGKEQVQAASVSIGRTAGSYLEEDGLRMITIREVYADSGWNGTLSFSPPVGDWSRPLRCRVSGYDLVVEVPAKSGTVIGKMFRLKDSDTITGSLSPWSGSFARVRN